MDHNLPHCDVVTVSYYSLLITITISHLLMQSVDGRYLRPSYHGLAYQNDSNSTRNDISEMLSFFGDGETATPTHTPLPEARNMSDPSATWWNRGGRRSRDSSPRDHVRDVLLIASLVCGLAGVVLLVVSAFVFLFRYRKKQAEIENQRRMSLSAASTSTSKLTLTIGACGNNVK